jgi:hypothetical protein
MYGSELGSSYIYKARKSPYGFINVGMPLNLNLFNGLAWL